MGTDVGTDARISAPPSAIADIALEDPVEATDVHVVRFDYHQRLQHILMMSTFIILAITGLPQKFDGLPASQWWVDLLGGLEAVRFIHRAAGFVMLSDCVYHLTYVSYRIAIQKRFGPLLMIPTLKDLQDVLQTMLYLLGLSHEKPKFDRFTYIEKFDYWAVFWGIAMIGGSGLALLYRVQVTQLLPGQTIQIARAIHSDEAMLAVGWIAVMHIFNAHLAPWIFPFNSSIFTGKVSVERYEEEHPLEWERIAAARSAQYTAAAAVAERERSDWTSEVSEFDREWTSRSIWKDREDGGGAGSGDESQETDER